MKKSLFAIATTIIICLSFPLLAQENPINDITIKIEGLKDGFYLRDELLKMEELVCTDKNYVVVSYTILFLGENGDIYEVRGNSSSFTSNAKNVLTSYEINGMIWIENIVASNNGSTISIQPVFIRLHDMFTGVNAKIELDGLRWHFDDTISKEDFLSNDRLKCTDTKLTITSFKLFILTKSGDIQEIKSKGPEISDLMKECINSDYFAGKVWIEDVLAVNENGEVIKINSLAFNIE